MTDKRLLDEKEIAGINATPFCRGKSFDVFGYAMAVCKAQLAKFSGQALNDEGLKEQIISLLNEYRFAVEEMGKRLADVIIINQATYDKLRSLIASLISARIAEAKKEREGEIIEFLDIHEDDGYVRISNHVSFEQWQSLIR